MGLMGSISNVSFWVAYNISAQGPDIESSPLLESSCCLESSLILSSMTPPLHYSGSNLLLWIKCRMVRTSARFVLLFMSPLGKFTLSVLLVDIVIETEIQNFTVVTRKK